MFCCCRGSHCNNDENVRPFIDGQIGNLTAFSIDDCPPKEKLLPPVDPTASLIDRQVPSGPRE